MKIQKIISQFMRDFTALYECEHCGATETGYVCDDANFHRKVIPAMVCKKCGKTAAEDFHPMGMREDTTLAECAEAWMRETGQAVPERGSQAWQELYEQWIGWAFLTKGEQK